MKVTAYASQQLRSASVQAVARTASTYRTTPFAPARSGPYWRNPNTTFRSPRTQLDPTAQYNLRISKIVSRPNPMIFEICREMKQAGVHPNFLTYDLLLQTCSALYMNLEAWAVFEDMIAMKILPERSTFGHLLNVRLSAFSAGGMF